MTGHGRLNNNFIADFYAFYGFADLSHYRGTFMADSIRISYDLRAYLAGRIIMNIAAAYAGSGEFKQHIRIVFYFRLRNIDKFQISHTC